jgi:hypothetical protein
MNWAYSAITCEAKRLCIALDLVEVPLSVISKCFFCGSTNSRDF